MSPEDPKNIDELGKAMIDAALDESASVRASRGETGKGNLSPLAGADNPDSVVRGVSVDTAVSSVTAEAGPKMIPGKTDLEGKKRRGAQNAGKNGAGRRRGGRGRGDATAQDKEHSALTEPPAREATQVVVTNDSNVDVSGVRNPYQDRKGTLARVQEEMDALAKGEMPDIPIEKSGNMDTGSVFSLEVEEEKIPVLTEIFKPGEQVREEAAHRESSVEIVSGEAEEPLDQKIARLKSEAEGLRAAYAKADYDETNAWARMRKFFGKTLKGIDEREWQEQRYGKEENYRDGLYWQAQYQNTLIGLKNAELARIKRNAGEGKGWKKEMADMIRYFDLDEVTNLIDARTQYRAKERNFPTAVFDTIGAAGRWYNSIPLKNKMMVTAALAGVTIASVASGGLAAGAMATALVGARRVFASAGLAVGMEALLESSHKTYRSEDTEKEIDRLFKETPGKGFDSLEAEMKKKAFAVDDRLQKAKLMKLLHKAGALTAGIAVGSGWLYTVMDKLGGHEVIDWVKEQFNGNGGDALVSGAVPSSGLIERRDIAPVLPSVHDALSGMPDIPINELPHEVPETSDFPIGPENPTGTEQSPISPSIESGAEAGSIGPDPIDTFIGQDIVAEKGDSVWKIAGRLADRLGLEGSGRTHFIDALKDKFGDVRLQAGETVNFADHGIDREFVESALRDADALTPEQAASIADHDARISEFAAAHPDVTLSNESVDALLRDSMDVSDTGGTGQATADMGTLSLHDDSDMMSPGTADDESSVTEGSADQEELSTADINLERDIVLGDKYDVGEYAEYFKENPEAFPEFRKMGESYFKFIFQENQGNMKAIGEMAISEFNGDPNEPTRFLRQFMKMAKETYGSRLGLPGPKEKVYEYVARMAMLGIEHPAGKRIIFPEYI